MIVAIIILLFYHSRQQTCIKVQHSLFGFYLFAHAKTTSCIKNVAPCCERLFQKVFMCVPGIRNLEMFVFLLICKLLWIKVRAKVNGKCNSLLAFLSNLIQQRASFSCGILFFFFKLMNTNVSVCSQYRWLKKADHLKS